MNQKSQIPIRPANTDADDNVSGLALVEEGIHWLRRIPLGTLIIYYTGSIPFILAFLYFWTDMSSSAFAHNHCSVAALGLSLMYYWMLYWQRKFCRKVQTSQFQMLDSDTSSGMMANFGRFTRFLFWQSLILLLFIPAGLLVIPAFWLYMIQQTHLVMEGTTRKKKHSSVKMALQANLHSPKKTIGLMLVLMLLHLTVFINWNVFLIAIPEIIRILTGLESMVSRSSLFLWNSTTLMVCLCLTYLSLDPLVKIAILLRTNAINTLTTGIDLRIRLRQLKRASQTGTFLVILGLGLLLFCVQPSLRANQESDPTYKSESSALSEPTSGQEEVPEIPVETLDNQLDETLKQRKYTWRMPKPDPETRAKEEDYEPPQWLEDFFDKLSEWLDNIFDKETEDPAIESDEGSSTGFLRLVNILQILAYGIVGLAVVVLLWQTASYFLNIRRAKAGIVSDHPKEEEEEPDLNREDVSPQAKTRSGWLQTAMELIERGDYRLAMRAVFLAQLVVLAERRIILLAKHKSNNDYLREVRRRGHAYPELIPVVRQNTQRYEGVWYGEWPVDQAVVLSFFESVENMEDLAA